MSVASAIVSLLEMRAPRAALAMAEDSAAPRVTRSLQPGRPVTPWRYRLGTVGVLAVVSVPLLIAGFPALSAALSDLCTI